MVKLYEIGELNLYKKFLLSLFTVLLLLGCEQSAEHLMEEHLDDNKDTEATSDHEEVAVLADESKDATDDKQKIQTTDKNELNKEQEKEVNTLSELKVHYIDAGQADATLFQFADGEENYTILYDTGDWNKNDVINYLDAQNIQLIDLVIISHPHADHIGQLAEIIKTFEVGEVWFSGNTSSSKTFQKSVEAIMASDADYYEPRRGETFEIGPMEIEVLHPNKLTGDLNEDSISLRFIYGDMKFVFTGDAYKRQELQMINSDLSVEADILQLGHHGSNTSSDEAFLKAVNPYVAIYSAGKDNSYGHPHHEVVSLIQNLGIDLYGTDVHGTIIVTTDGTDYDLLTKEDGTISPESTGTSNNHTQHNNQLSDDHKKDEQEKNNNKTNKNCININHASFEELQNIIHIGPARAQDIIDQRPFDSIDDLTKIKGIGSARIKDIKDQGLACVGG